MPTPRQPTDSAKPDGRRKRTVETRKSIVQALIELIREGVVSPTSEDVSARAGVGLRTVFRHFDDMETLYQEIEQEIQKLIYATLHMQYRSQGWRHQLLESIAMRGALYDEIIPFFRASQVHRHESAVIAANMQQSALLQRSVLKRHLPKDIQADKARFAALLLALSPEAWIRLRVEQHLSFKAAVATVELMVKSLLPE